MTRNRGTPLFVAPLLLVALSAAMASAGRRGYTPPTGFNGLTWGASLKDLGPAKLARANIATDSKGKTTQLRCVEKDDCAHAVENSDQSTEGRGSFAVAEYYRDADRNPWATELVALHSATYAFCDEWQGSTVRTDVKQRLKLCGARIFYRSQSNAELAAKPAGFESNHDRVLRHLIAEYGPYDGQRVRKGEVSVGPVVETHAATAVPDQEVMPAATDQGATDQGVIRYRWCGLPQNSSELVPDCNATITLMFNRDTGWGMVLFATGPLYKFAYARHITQDENNELYMALVSRDPGKPTRRNANDCLRTTGSLICEGKLVPMRDAERRRFEP